MRSFVLKIVWKTDKKFLPPCFRAPFAGVKTRKKTRKKNVIIKRVFKLIVLKTFFTPLPITFLTQKKTKARVVDKNAFSIKKWNKKEK